ncbi:hypothetical protein ACVWXO_006615 [Bradyrhizobium sp. LM2.7]
MQTTKPGQDVNGIARDRGRPPHEMPGVRALVDMRDLAEVVTHIHDQNIEERQGRPATDLQ